MNTHTCPTCHATIPDHAPGGLCPACALRAAAETPATAPGIPPLDDIAAAFPQWEVLELIGRGGMGFVFKVRQPALDRIVALKILDPALGDDPAFAERFSREARTLAMLHHPNIVTIFEHGFSQPFFYLLMEFVDGMNLRQAMQAGRFAPEQALALIPGICDALQAAHAQGVWHRDIKPENLLLDRDGRVKIADFGIARLVGDPQRDFTLTRTGHALGSAAYMAPEQHERAHDVDHRADIYSLGVVIYEMLTGELPLGRFPLPSQRAEVNSRIDEIVLRTLEKERELRQQSAGEVKTEVEIAAKECGRASILHDASPSWASRTALVLGVLGAVAVPTLSGFLGWAEVIAIVIFLWVVALTFGLVGMKHSGRTRREPTIEKRGPQQQSAGKVKTEAGKADRKLSLPMKWTLLGCCALLLALLISIPLGFLIYYLLPVRQAVESPPTRVEARFTHPDVLPGADGLVIPLVVSKFWTPMYGKPITLKDARQVLVRARLVDVVSNRVAVVLVGCSSDGKVWETRGAKVGPGSAVSTIQFSNGTMARIGWEADVQTDAEVNGQRSAPTPGSEITPPAPPEYDLSAARKDAEPPMLRENEDRKPGEADTELPEKAVLEILKDGAYRLAGEACPSEELVSRLSRFSKAGRKKVVIHVDETVKYQQVLEAMKACEAAGLVDMSFDSAAPAPDDPKIAMEAILKAAREHDKAALRERDASALDAFADGDGNLPEPFELLARAHFVEEKRIDENTAEVVVETTDGTKRKFTFRMILEDGKWKLTEHGH